MKREIYCAELQRKHDNVIIRQGDTQHEDHTILFTRISVLTRHDTELGLHTTIKSLTNDSFSSQFLVESFLLSGDGSVGLLLMGKVSTYEPLQSLIARIRHHRPRTRCIVCIDQ